MKLLSKVTKMKSKFKMYKNKNVFITINGSLGRDLISNFTKKRLILFAALKEKY